MLKSEVELISEVVSKNVEEFAARIEKHEPYNYEMRKTAREGKCFFLTENACTIYASRPLICRFYPFQLEPTKDGEYKFFYTKECPGIFKGTQLGKEYFENLFKHARERLVGKTASEK